MSGSSFQPKDKLGMNFYFDASDNTIELEGVCGNVVIFSTTITNTASLGEWKGLVGDEACKFKLGKWHVRLWWIYQTPWIDFNYNKLITFSVPRDGCIKSLEGLFDMMGNGCRRKLSFSRVGSAEDLSEKEN